MFTKNTVFILGAGASWHYGYPTGEALIHKVIREAEETAHFIEHDEAAPQLYWPKYLSEKHNLDQNRQLVLTDTRREHLRLFAADCIDLSKRLTQSNPLVIDYFLGQNPRLQDIGKLFIAKVILNCEKLSQNQKNINRPIAERASTKDDWCRFIVHKIIDDCTAENINNNKVTFITFNYDTSLESSVYKILNNIEYFQEDKTIASFISTDRFLHIYGHVCERSHDDNLIAQRRLGDYEKNTIAYRCIEKEIELNDAYKASQGIRTINSVDKELNEGVFIKAKDAIKKAENIYILGYGFDHRNSNRLNLNCLAACKEDKSKKTVYFTNYEDRNQINKRASEILLKSPDQFLPPNFIKSAAFNTRKFEKSIKNVYEALERDFDI